MTVEGAKEIIYPYSYAAPSTREPVSFASTVSELRRNIAPFRFGLAAAKIVSELNITSDDKVLELGGGLGLMAEAIKERVGSGLSYFGVDLIFDSAAKSVEKGVISAQSNVTALPFADGSFDSLISTDVLEHVPDAGAAVREIHRVLKPGSQAFVVIADPAEGRFRNVHDHINRGDQATNVPFWTNLFNQSGLAVDESVSRKYRSRDWRKVFNLPLLAKLKDRPGFACAFNPIYRPGTYLVQKAT